MKILLVEDEISLGNSICEYLQNEQIICEYVKDIESAKEKIELYSYDALVLDLMLPDGNGLDLLQWIKRKKNTSNVLLISAQNQLDIKISGLNMGADDYITKPFALAELVARLRVVYRRNNPIVQNILELDNLSIDFDAHIVKADGKEINLTKKELNLLIYFVNNKNRVLSKQSIACHLWGDYTDNLDNVDFVYQHVKNLRKKLIDAGVHDYLQTVYGIGYKFEVA